MSNHSIAEELFLEAGTAALVDFSAWATLGGLLLLLKKNY
jgi:hypothetical protein